MALDHEVQSVVGVMFRFDSCLSKAEILLTRMRPSSEIGDKFENEFVIGIVAAIGFGGDSIDFWPLPRGELLQQK